MQTFVPIEFHRARDFSKKLNVTFEFLKQNFKSLTKSILFISGPPILMGSLLMGSFVAEIFNLAQLGIDSPDSGESLETFFTSANFWLKMIFGFLFILISGVSSLSVINNYILLYGEKQSNQIEVNEVWTKVKQTFWMYLGTTILFAFLIMAVYLILLLPMFLLSAISPFLVGFGVIGMIVGIIYFFFGASFTFFIRAYEKKGFIDAIRRSFYLVHGKWWSTFGLLFILTLIVSTISYLFIIPWYIMTVVSALHDTTGNPFADPSNSWKVITLLSFTLYYLAQMVLYSLPNIGIAFQYFNLVELKEARGLMSEIESLGTDSNSDSREEHY